MGGAFVAWAAWWVARAARAEGEAKNWRMVAGRDREGERVETPTGALCSAGWWHGMPEWRQSAVTELASTFGVREERRRASIHTQAT